ncbi:MAG: sulfatase-like hydrolase/transferase [Nitrospirae bacterium]|nr:sulfatase-like hydrolase/transferase [Nitrospirota bacterium]
MAIAFLSAMAIWFLRNSIWSVIYLHRELLFLSIIILSLSLTWLFRNSAERWMNVLYERITPLSWIFGIWFLVSVPIVGYHGWFKQANDVAPQIMPSSSITDKERPNIILVIFDALAARNMSVYDYPRETTPFISKWAEKASLFVNVKSDSNWTTPAMASLMTGKRIWTHQLFQPGDAGLTKNQFENVPLVMKNNDYYNIAFVANPKASPKSIGINGSFHVAPTYREFNMSVNLYGFLEKPLSRLFKNKIRLHNWILQEDFILRRLTDIVTRDFSETVLPPENVFERFIFFLEKNKLQKPYFAWLHVLPPHDPYLPPEPYMGMFNSSNEMSTLKSQWRIFQNRKGVSFISTTKKDVETLRDRYDEFVRYCDNQFENFIARLNTTGSLKNTIIIFSTDHGESFEHNYLGHGDFHLYEQVTHIPLIIKEPEQNQGRIIYDLAEQIDISATILDLAHIPIPDWIEGRSTVPLLKDKELSARPAFSMNLERYGASGRKTAGSVAVWHGEYKLIHYLKEDKSLLFDLAEDPDELNDLSDKKPEVYQHLIELIQEHLDIANQSRIKTG